MGHDFGCMLVVNV